MRVVRSFTHKGARFRICCPRFGAVTAEILRQRRLLEAHIRRHPAFAAALEPLDVEPDVPEVVRRMAAAARAAGVGPMAAVAGAMAQLAAEAALAAGAEEAIIENGGDIFLSVRAPATVRLDAGQARLADALALRIRPDETPLAVCSSSGTMGHSLSFGQCDLATVTARDAALADAAATRAANLVTAASDIPAALETVLSIAGVRGVLLVKADRVGLAGNLPELVRVRGTSGAHVDPGPPRPRVAGESDWREERAFPANPAPLPPACAGPACRQADTADRHAAAGVACHGANRPRGTERPCPAGRQPDNIHA